MQKFLALFIKEGRARMYYKSANEQILTAWFNRHSKIGITSACEASQEPITGIVMASWGSKKYHAEGCRCNGVIFFFPELALIEKGRLDNCSQLAAVFPPPSRNQLVGRNQHTQHWQKALGCDACVTLGSTVVFIVSIDLTNGRVGAGKAAYFGGNHLD